MERNMSAKILVVDDSLTARKMISGMLSSYTVLTACDGKDALRMIDENPDIDLVILDLNMPVMDGFEVLRILKSEARYARIRTIILTNYDEIDNEIKGLKLGAIDYIRKPVNIESLLIRIDIHLKLKQAQELLEQENLLLDQAVREKTAAVQELLEKPKQRDSLRAYIQSGTIASLCHESHVSL
jgi:putative two-component system response regulator